MLFQYCPIAVALVFMFMHSTLATEQITITSTLKKNSLCPGELGATFTCAAVAVGPQLLWRINGSLISFTTSSEIGSLQSINGYTASLFSRSTVNGTYTFISILRVRSELPSGMLRVECYSDARNRFADRAVEFYPFVTDVPSAPRIQSNRSIMVEIQKKILHHIVLDPESVDTGISHYELSINDDPYNHTQSGLNFAIISEYISNRSNYTLHVRAMDVCGRRSIPSTCVDNVIMEQESTCPTTSSFQYNKGHSISKTFFLLTVVLSSVFSLAAICT